MFGLLLALIYLSFISLGLPDSLLGSAWPVLHNDIGVPMSWAGIISMLISGSTIVSSLLSDRMVKKLGYGMITALSTLLTVVGLIGFSASNSFFALVLCAVPYGLGAGGVDAVLNNYVAVHYKAQHMSWLHCFWGVGASVSPYIMSFSLVRLNSWSKGYLIVAVIQAVVTALLFVSLPLWKKSSVNEKNAAKPLKLKEIFAIVGAVPCFITFFCYCALELSASLWASSYLVQTKGVTPATASAFASLFYIGITAGRAVNGFLAMRFSDKRLIRMGEIIIAVGLVMMLLPFGKWFALAGFIVIGLGCAPIYPCIIHMTPSIFGADKSQAMIGVQMAFAYIGFCIMPSLFGFIAENFSIALMPAYLSILLVIMTLMHETVIRKTKK